MHPFLKVLIGTGVVGLVGLLTWAAWKAADEEAKLDADFQKREVELLTRLGKQLSTEDYAELLKIREFKVRKLRLLRSDLDIARFENLTHDLDGV
jgi:hypothetical protein